MNTVRAKFKCNAITEYEGAKQVSLSPVMSGSEENKTFWQYTPSGEIKMQIEKSSPAADGFVVGQEYYIDFTPAS